jgi:hypothetical protein
MHRDSVVGQRPIIFLTVAYKIMAKVMVEDSFSCTVCGALGADWF